MGLLRSSESGPASRAHGRPAVASRGAGRSTYVLVAVASLVLADAEGGADMLAVSQVKTLSTRGSTRATNYTLSNKVVTRAGKTHVTWLDSVSEIMAATYDHRSAAWSESVHVGSGKDCYGKGLLNAVRAVQLRWGVGN